MRAGRLIALPVLIGAATVAPVCAAQDAAPSHPLHLDDVLALEQLREAIIAPDGSLIAAVISRPRAGELAPPRDYLDGEERADIWLVTPGGDRHALTAGRGTGQGAWKPRWSEHSRRLAYLNMHADGVVELIAWDRVRGEAHRVSGAVDVNVLMPGRGAWQPYLWLGDTALLWFGPTDSSDRAWRVDMSQRKPRSAALDWAVAGTTDQLSQSTAVSGRVPGGANPMHRQLLHVTNVVSGLDRVVGGIDVANNAAAERTFVPSPDGTRLAFCSDDSVPEGLPAQRLLVEPDAQGPARAGIVNLVGPPKVRWIALATGWILQECVNGIQWSPNGSALALLAARDRADTTFRPFVVDTATLTARPIDDRDQPTRRLGWTSHGQLLVDHPDGTDDAWWVVDAGRSIPPRRLTLDRACQPGERWHRADGPPLRVLGNAIVSCRADLRPDPLVSLPPGEWTIADVSTSPSPAATVVVLTNASGEPGLARVSLTAGRALVTVARRPVNSILRSVDDGGRHAVFTSLDASGATDMWTVDLRAGHIDTILVLNPWLSQVCVGRRIAFRYATTSGDSLLATAELPPGYQAGTRYPAILVVYGGAVNTDTLSSAVAKSEALPISLELLATHGYVVINASIPLPPYGTASDPVVEFPKVTLGAIDRAAQLGIIDSTAVALYGHSYGAYTAVALLTRSRRFKAAAALNGFYDLGSMYATFSANREYDPSPQMPPDGALISENGQFRLGTMPWRDPTRYVENSPFYQLDRIQTPLLIVATDVDFIPMQQAEELFSGLFRLDRPAKLVRYWGEGHIINRPADARDLWNQLYEWFDHYLNNTRRPPASCDASGVRGPS